MIIQYLLDIEIFNILLTYN